MSAPCLNLADTITLILTDNDDYAGDTINSQADVRASVDMATGYSEGNNQVAITSDAVAYIGSSDQFVKNNYNRLEEMLVKIPLFGTPDALAWYKVTRVAVARDTQLCNNIDHLELYLKKTAPIEAQDVS